MISFSGVPCDVSTHSRPKAAGILCLLEMDWPLVSTHSRPKAAGFCKEIMSMIWKVSTHSRPKAAGQACVNRFFEVVVSTHSRPKAAGWVDLQPRFYSIPFQHTAARRRLGPSHFRGLPEKNVSTHSRPKAAGRRAIRLGWCVRCFNTQPPEGGWAASH